MLTHVESPFGEPIDEIPLSDPPLVLTIAQLRFPQVVSIHKEEFIAPFQEQLRNQFPVMRQSHEFEVTITPDGEVRQSEKSAVWRLRDRDGDWQVSLGPSFVALDTRRYSTRDDFVERFEAVVRALQDVVQPALYDRLGLRHIDRLTGRDATDDLAELVRPEVLGTLGVALPDDVDLEQTLSQTRFAFDDDAYLLARWGRVPASTTVHDSIDPVEEPSWILDLDAYVAGERDFDPDIVCKMLAQFADRTYHFFRWAVTDELIRRSGGDL